MDAISTRDLTKAFGRRRVLPLGWGFAYDLTPHVALSDEDIGAYASLQGGLR